jgi:hypothetical protein
MANRAHKDYADKTCPCGGKYGDENHTNPDCINFSTRTTKEEVIRLQAFMQGHWVPVNVEAHAAGKAHCYLGRLVRENLLNKELSWKTSRLVDACRGVSSGRLGWKVLDNAMRGWF